MAKVKQKKSVQEMLEEAIVPKDQEPFAIPKNWCWVKVDCLGKLGMGQTILSKELKDKGTPVFSATETDKIFGFIEEKDNTIKLDKGDIVIPARGNSIGYVKYIDHDRASCTQTTMYFKPLLKSIGKYIYYYFRGFKDKLFLYYGNAIPQITIKSIGEKLIPLAPIEEQKRIVDKIESLFSRLDEAKDLIQKSLDEFEDRKSAILQKAFNGVITKSSKNIYDKENIKKFANELDVNYYTINNNNWIETSAQEICTEKINCGHTPTGKLKEKEDIPFLKVYNIVGNKLDFNYKPQFIDKETCQKLKSSILLPGDVIMNIVGPPLRKIAIITDQYPLWNMNQAIVRFRLKNNIMPKFVYYQLLWEPTLNDVLNKTKGVVGQQNISVSQSRQLKILLPMIEEQQEIVRILDEFFEKEDKSKELLDMIDQIEEMKKSILSCAFRGELGTHSDTDEPAIELVKKIYREER